MSKILLCIDLQKQFRADGYDECLAFIEEQQSSYDKIVATLFVNDKKVNANYIKKLGWKDCQDAKPNDLDFKADQIVIKNGYGFPSGFFSKDDHIDIIGCETDACILATCFSLWDDGIDFSVLWDYVYTSAKIKDKELRKVFERNFGL